MAKLYLFVEKAKLKLVHFSIFLLERNWIGQVVNECEGWKLRISWLVIIGVAECAKWKISASTDGLLLSTQPCWAIRDIAHRCPNSTDLYALEMMLRRFVPTWCGQHEKCKIQFKWSSISVVQTRLKWGILEVIMILSSSGTMSTSLRQQTHEFISSYCIFWINVTIGTGTELDNSGQLPRSPPMVGTENRSNQSSSIISEACTRHSGYLWHRKQRCLTFYPFLKNFSFKFNGHST